MRIRIRGRRDWRSSSADVPSLESPHFVIPAKAGIHFAFCTYKIEIGFRLSPE
jgi:hypothetical protein